MGLPAMKELLMSLLSLPGVVGAGPRRDSLVVYVRSADVEVPEVIDGYPVDKVITGRSLAGRIIAR